MGYNNNDAFADGWLKLEQVGSDTLFKLDKDGDGDNFDTLIATLKDFTLSNFKQDNTDTGSAIPKDTSLQSNYVQNTILDSSFISFDSLNKTQENSDNLSKSNQNSSLAEFISLESEDSLELNLVLNADDYSEISLVSNASNQINSIISDPSYIDSLYESDEFLFIDSEILI